MIEMNVKLLIDVFFLDRMASQKQLRAGVVFVDRMPRTIIGKLDRQYFKNMAKDELLTEIC
jgi:acyl-coenzyme A synthetase/AMP-(fatty) acid ligase